MVVTEIDPLVVFVPIMFPSPVLLPPMFMPEPLVSNPIKTLAAVVEVGTADTEMPATVLPFILDAGVALLVVSNMPWYDIIPKVEL